jgi:hypothetical protein
LLLDSNDTSPLTGVYRDHWRTRFADGRLQWIPAALGGAIEKVDFAAIQFLSLVKKLGRLC